MNQHRLAATESGRVINAMAAGSKEGAADIPYLTEAMEKSGTTLAMMNVSLEENIGLIETVAPFYSKAQLAGNSLDKVFLKMKADQIGYVDGVFSVNAALDELAIRYKGGETSANLFGVEHSKMGELLVQNRGEFNRYTKAVTGTNIAIEQAIKNTNNNAARKAQELNKINLGLIDLGEKMNPLLLKTLSLTSRFIRLLAKLATVSPVKELQQQQEQVGRLAVQLTNSNTPLEQRKKTLIKLKEISPDIIKGLDAENLNYETLRDNLEEYNKELSNRILLENLSEEEKKYAAKVAKYKQRLGELQLNILDVIANTDQEIALSNETLEWKLSKTYDMLTKKASGYIQITTGGGSVDYRNEEAKDLAKLYILTGELERAQAGLNRAQGKEVDFQGRTEELRKILGLTKQIITTSESTDPDDGNDNSVVNSSLEHLHAFEILRIKQYYADKENLQKESQARLLASELAYLHASSALETDDEKRISLQSKIIDKQLEYNQALKQAIPEIINTDDAVEKLNTRLLEQGKLTSYAAKKQYEGITASEAASSQQMQQTQTIQMVSDVMTDYVSGALSGTLDEYATFGDTLILMSLQILKQMVPIWSAQILGYSLADPISVATVGVKGMINFAAVTALLYAGVAAAEGAVRGGIESRRDSANQYASGKYPVMGADDGKFYDTNFVGRPKTGIYSGPQLGIFNEDPSNPELVVDGKTTRQLMIDYPAVYRGIRQLATGATPQFASGKYPTQTPSTSVSSADPELLKAITQLNKYLSNPIRASINKYGTGGVDEALTDIEKFNKKVFKTS